NGKLLDLSAQIADGPRNPQRSLSIPVADGDDVAVFEKIPPSASNVGIEVFLVRAGSSHHHSNCRADCWIGSAPLHFALSLQALTCSKIRYSQISSKLR